MKLDYIIIIVCALLAIFSVYREYQRLNKKHLPLRILAVALAVIALGCLVYPLTYATNISNTGKGKILLTEGFDKDSIGATDSVFTTDPAVHQQYPKAKLLADVSELFADTLHQAPIHILGYGLDENQLKQLAHHPALFQSSPLPDGFSAINWAQRVKAGQTFTVQGGYQNTSAKAIKLVLSGLHTGLDSVIIPAKGNTPFTLKTSPKNSGRVVFSLIASTDKDTLKHESLPAIVEPTLPVKVLILSSSPDFETKFFKQWLGGNGYGVAARSNITKGKFGQDYLNMEKVDLAHLSAGLLNKFDVVIGDLSVLNALSPAESSALQQEISQKGLGLIIRADSSDKKSTWLQSDFRVDHQTGKLAAPSALIIPGKGKTAKLNVDPDFIIAQGNMQTLISDEHNHQLAAVTISGSGKIIFSTIRNTYSWALAGNQTDYTAVWSTLLDKALRKSAATESWSVKTSLPKVGEPVDLVLESALPGSSVKVNQTVIYPAQNPVVSFQQTFTYWPANYGWQQVTRQNGKSYWWYVWQKGDWQTLDAANKIALTKKYIGNSLTDSTVTKQIQQKSRTPVPKIYFFILFLMAATFLWAESKFFS